MNDILALKLPHLPVPGGPPYSGLTKEIVVPVDPWERFNFMFNNLMDNVLGKTISLQEIFHNTWFLVIGGVLVYIIGGIMLRNALIRHEARQPNTTDELTGEDINSYFFVQAIFPISLVFTMIVVALTRSANSMRKVYEDEKKKVKK